MNKVLLLVLVAAFLILPTAALAQVNVTFLVNTATVPDTIKANSPVVITGGGPVLTDWGAGVPLRNIGGDYWDTTLSFAAGTNIAYKIRIGANGWEENLSPTNDRTLTVPATDTTLMLQFWNNGHLPAGKNPPFYAKPWTDVADSLVSVWFRVNVLAIMNSGSYGWTAADVDSVVVMGGTPGLSWDTPVYLTQEQPPTNGAGQFTIPATSFFSGRVTFPKRLAGETVNYKFRLGTQWQLNGVERSEQIGPNRTFVLPANDTTLQWVYFANDAPVARANPDTVVVTFRANMTEAIQRGSFAIGDTLQVQSGFFSTADSVRTWQMLRQGLTNFYQFSDTIISAVNKLLDYQYYLVKNGNAIREYYFNFDYTGQTGAEQERRQVLLTSKDVTVLDTARSVTNARRMPYFENQRKLSQSVAVRWVVDMRPAYYQIWAGDSLADGQGTAHVKDVDSIAAWGVGINGPATGGPNGPLSVDWATWDRTLVADTSARKMWDDGTHGDLVAGDTMYTVIFRYTTNNTVGKIFKFGIRGGDNESGFGLNHLENISDADTTFTLNTQWGSINPNKYSAWDYDAQAPRTTDVAELSTLPEEFRLEQNYPNPFNPSTKIQFALPSQALVQLKVYNVLGQEVATVVNQVLNAGRHQVVFDATNLATGMYVYKITAGKFVSTKKMLLMK